jgi:ABC-2 type transport system ATP-binding protein
MKTSRSSREAMLNAAVTDQRVLEVDDLSFGYGDGFRLEGISFAVEARSFTALLGPNGAGKTTLFSLLTRLFDSDRRHSGLWPGPARRIVAGLGVHGRRLPTADLDLDLTVVQNLRYFAGLHGVSAREAEKRISAELERLEPSEPRRDKVRRLSGGYRRRVEVARALLHRPSLLLLDEPTVELDVPTRRSLVEHVHALAREDGIAVLWATHLIDEIAPDDRVVVLHRGRVRAAGTVGDVNAAAGCASIGETLGRVIAERPSESMA